MQLIPPSSEAVELQDSELAHMKAVLTLDKTAGISSEILGKTYSRFRPPKRQVAGSVRTTLPQDDCCRYYLVLVLSKCKKRARGSEEDVPANVYDAVHHDVVVYIAQEPVAFAHIE